MEDAAHAQNGRVGHHPQQDDADELHLLDVVGGAGDEGSGGEILDLRVGEVDDRGKGLPAQVAADGGGNAGGDEAHKNGYGHHQQGQAQHLPAHPEEVLHLDVMGDALRFVLQADEEGGLTGHAGKGGLVHLRQCTGQLLLDHLAGEARHLGHGGKLGAHGVEVVSSGGDGLRFVGALCRRRSGAAGGFFPGRSRRILRKRGQALGGHPGAVGGLGSRHIQHDVRHSHGLFEGGAFVGGQVTAQFQNAVVLNVILVGVLKRSGVLLTHQKREGVQRGGAQGLGQGAFNAALLDAGVHDLAGVVRQGKVAVRLHEQQCEHHKADCPVPGQLLKDLCHGSFLPSGQCCARHFPQEWHPSARRAARPSGLPAPALTVPARWQSSCAEPAHTGGTARTPWG